MTEYFDDRSKTWDQYEYRVERARIVAERIMEYIPVSPGTSVLDFGCGTGLLGLNMTDAAGKVTLADSSPGMIEQVRNKIADQKIGNAIPLLLTGGTIPGSYDLIVSLLVLHHIEDVPAQISALSKCLKPGGSLCLCDLDCEDGSFHQNEKVPHNGFERSFIEQLMEDNGLEPVHTSTVFVNRRPDGDRVLEYPVFQIIGRKKNGSDRADTV